MTPSALAALQRRIRRELRARGDANRARQMQAYMKSPLPYAGVPMPAVRRLARQSFRDVTFDSAAAFIRAVRTLYGSARVREERYVALALLKERSTRRFQTMAALPLYRWLIVTGAWWDLVDEVAGHALGPLHDAFPGPMRARMLAWSKSDDLWLRRAAIISQLARRGREDFALLEAVIEPALDSKEFFLRKAIGWALRNVAWTRPALVQRYVKAHRARLSPLSVREALKNVGPG